MIEKMIKRVIKTIEMIEMMMKIKIKGRSKNERSKSKSRCKHYTKWGACFKAGRKRKIRICEIS